jgi:alkaline phosphatase
MATRTTIKLWMFCTALTAGVIVLAGLLGTAPVAPSRASDEPASSTSQPARSIILMIGDGMGYEQVKAASFFAWGENGKLTMQSMPVKGRCSTYDAGGPEHITDSAAAGTALATGVKVNNGVISMRIPGDDGKLPTILELAQKRDWRTGLVATSYITHATPAAFASHVKSRNMHSPIAAQMLRTTKPDLILGGGGRGMSVADARLAGWSVATNRASLQHLLDRPRSKIERIAGLFGEGHMPYEYEYAMRIDPRYDRLPHLSEMTAAALEYLGEGESDGMFLMIEGSRIDHAGHMNDIQRNILETLEFDSAVRIVLEWARSRPNTLVIVTADHECGGLDVVKNNGRGEWPEVSWGSKGHTNVTVPVYAAGAGAKEFAGKMDNTDIFAKMKAFMNAPLPKGDAKVTTDSGSGY